MKKLEFRFYSLDEIAAATGKTERGDNFKRDTERLLARKGYSYEWHKGSGVTILSRDKSALRRLKTLLVKHLGMHPDTDPLHFAYFIMALSWIEGFESAPWPEKPAMLYELFGINPSESTLKRWAAKLYESGNATRFRKGALWKTITDEYGMKRRIRIDPESAEYKEFCDIRSATIQSVLKENEQAKASGQGALYKNAFGEASKRLYGKFGYYRYCPAIVLNALGDDVEEITRLVHEIVEAPNTE